MRIAVMGIVLGFALLGAGAAVAQTVPDPGGVIGAATDAVKEAEQAAADAVDAVIPGAGDTAKAIADGLAKVADGSIISEVVGSALGSLEKGLLDMVTEHAALKQRVTVLEQENAKKDIEVQAAKAKHDSLAAKLEQLNAAVTEVKAAQDAEIAALKAKVAELEKAQGTVKAPFKVVGPGGAAVLTVTAEGDALFGNPPVLTVRTSKSGEVSLAMGSGGAGAVVLTAAGDSGKVVATGPEADVTLGSAPELAGLLVKKGGQPAAGLGSLDGRAVALRLFSASGGTIVAGGENPSSPGSGILYVGDGSKNLAALAGDGAGGGIVHAFAPDGTVGAGLVGAERMVAAYNASGAAVATIMKSDKSEGGNVTTRDPSGEGVFSAGFNSEVGGGDACVYRAKRQAVSCLGISLPGIGLVNP